MPNQCQHFKLLKERLESLKAKFLDVQLAAEANDPLNFQADIDQLAAFRLLFHAEIEGFLEGKAKENVDRISSSLVSPKWIRNYPELLSLAFALKKQTPSDELDTTKFNQFVQTLISGANTSIKENNGIKSPSFTLLSICAGKTIDEVDSVLSGSLNSYGKDRGDVAHKSVTQSRTINAPTAELATATSIVTQIAAYFDVHE